MHLNSELELLCGRYGEIWGDLGRGTSTPSLSSFAICALISAVEFAPVVRVRATGRARARVRVCLDLGYGLGLRAAHAR